MPHVWKTPAFPVGTWNNMMKSYIVCNQLWSQRLLTVGSEPRGETSGRNPIGTTGLRTQPVVGEAPCSCVAERFRGVVASLGSNIPEERDSHSVEGGRFADCYTWKDRRATYISQIP